MSGLIMRRLNVVATEAALDRVFRQPVLYQPILAERHQRRDLTVGRMPTDEQLVSRPAMFGNVIGDPSQGGDTIHDR